MNNPKNRGINAKPKLTKEEKGIKRKEKKERQRERMLQENCEAQIVPDPLGDKRTHIPEVIEDSDKLPASIVWTSLPYITQLFPSVGHTGIVDNSGVIHDFHG